jgi:hypothetical protein
LFGASKQQLLVVRLSPIYMLKVMILDATTTTCTSLLKIMEKVKEKRTNWKAYQTMMLNCLEFISYCQLFDVMCLISHQNGVLSVFPPNNVFWRHKGSSFGDMRMTALLTQPSKNPST